MKKEYAGAPLTDGHVGFDEPRVFPVRPDKMPDAYMMELGQATNPVVSPAHADEASEATMKREPSSYWPTQTEREVGKAAIENIRKRRERSR